MVIKDKLGTHFRTRKLGPNEIAVCMSEPFYQSYPTRPLGATPAAGQRRPKSPAPMVMLHCYVIDKETMTLVPSIGAGGTGSGSNGNAEAQ